MSARGSKRQDSSSMALPQPEAARPDLPRGRKVLCTLLNGSIRETPRRLDLPLLDLTPCIGSNLGGADVFEGHAGVHMSAADDQLSDPALLQWMASE